MVEIEIKIPRGFLAWRWTKTLRRQFAEAASELDTEQLLTYCRITTERFQSEGAMKITLLSRLYQLPIMLLFAMSRVQLAQLTLHLDPLLPTFSKITHNHLTRLKIKTFRKATLLIGPGDNLTHVRLGEFIVADQYFEAYQNTQEDQYIELLIATLWREKDKADSNGDWRVPFKSAHIKERAAWTKRLPAEEKMLIYLYFAGCKAELAERYDTLFSSEEKGEGGDWLDMVRTLPNDKFGTLTMAEQMYVHTVFNIVNRMMQDQKKQKNESH